MRSIFFSMIKNLKWIPLATFVFFSYGQLSFVDQNSASSTPKIREYQVSFESNDFCILVRHIGCAVFNF